MVDKRDRLVILGAGYLARFILPLTSFYPSVFYTSRDPETHLGWVHQQQRVRFDLAQPSTWKNLPSGADLLWCFPATPLEAVRSFAQASRAFGTLVVLGSTSAYDVGDSSQSPPAWIDETSPVDFSKPRVQGEEFLRHEYKAMVLRVAGIYGPARHPYNWIKTGRVSLSDKYVNLIHVEDLAAVCQAALQYGVPGEIYNVSDGVPRTWKEIGHRLYGDDASRTSAGEPQQSGKRISTAKLRALLQDAHTSIRHPDLFHSLERLGDDHTPA